MNCLNFKKAVKNVVVITFISLGFVMLAPQPADAGFRDVIKKIKKVPKKIIKETKKAIKRTIEYVEDPKLVVQSLQNRYTQVRLNYCQQTKAYGFKTYCFEQEQLKSIENAMTFMSSNNTPLANKTPLVVVGRGISGLFNGENRSVRSTFFYIKRDKGFLAVNNGVGRLESPVQLYKSSFVYGDEILSSILLHEADHSYEGSHSCGPYADKDEFGPYGLETRYLINVYHTADLDRFTKSRIRGFIVSRINNRFCGNQEVQARLRKLLSGSRGEIVKD